MGTKKEAFGILKSFPLPTAKIVAPFLSFNKNAISPISISFGVSTETGFLSA